MAIPSFISSQAILNAISQIPLLDALNGRSIDDSYLTPKADTTLEETANGVIGGGTGGGNTDPTFALVANDTAVDEGATTTFALTTTNVAEGTDVAFTLTGVDAADVTGGLTGNATVDAAGAATISLELIADSLTEGEETLTITLDGDATVTQSVTVNDTSLTDPNASTFTLAANDTAVNEGATTTFALTTTNVAEGTDVAFTLTGVDAADVTGGLTGNATVDAAGAATISLELIADSLTEGEETLTITLDDDATATQSVTVNDTSLDPVAGATINVNAQGIDDSDANSIEDVSNVDATTFVFEQGNYTYEVAGFSPGDVLDILDGATPNISNIAVDGTLLVEIADSNSGSVVAISLTGVDQTLDGQVFNLDSFNTTFGADTFI